jgi:hypothetical protein
MSVWGNFRIDFFFKRKLLILKLCQESFFVIDPDGDLPGIRVFVIRHIDLISVLPLHVW